MWADRSYTCAVPNEIKRTAAAAAATAEPAAAGKLREGASSPPAGSNTQIMVVHEEDNFDNQDTRVEDQEDRQDTGSGRSNSHNGCGQKGTLSTSVNHGPMVEDQGDSWTRQPVCIDQGSAIGSANTQLE